MVVNLNALFSCYTVTLCFYGSMTKYPSIKPPLHIKKHLKNVDTSTIYIMNHLQLTKWRNRQWNNKLWYNCHSAKMSAPILDTDSFSPSQIKHFPKDHKLRKIFNCNTIKISYSCMNNTKQIINNHNKCILNSSKHIHSMTPQMTPTQKTKKLATADRKTYARSMETASNHH